MAVTRQVSVDLRVRFELSEHDTARAPKLAALYVNECRFAEVVLSAAGRISIHEAMALALDEALDRLCGELGRTEGST